MQLRLTCTNSEALSLVCAFNRPGCSLGVKFISNVILVTNRQSKIGGESVENYSQSTLESNC